MGGCVPLSASSSPAIILRRVDFPHPDGPSIEKNSPDDIVSEISEITRVEPKLLVICERERALIGWGITARSGLVDG
jgi:hypothetical protein